jgi:murein DD-endopeptidase MepM/ murein hydrolase activator NlpD
VRGKHTYGDGIGAGRGHQGVDLLAKCGKRIVAAEPGRVRYVKYQSAAGNYVVVKGPGRDEVYMHLAKPSKLKVGTRVDAGDTIGRVGQTGRASACHLHFEMWSKPGWYRGGAVMDPTPYLKQWDKTS